MVRCSRPNLPSKLAGLIINHLPGNLTLLEAPLSARFALISKRSKARRSKFGYFCLTIFGCLDDT